MSPTATSGGETPQEMAVCFFEDNTFHFRFHNTSEKISLKKK